MNNITSEGLSLLLSTGPLSFNNRYKVTVFFSLGNLPQYVFEFLFLEGKGSQVLFKFQHV